MTRGFIKIAGNAIIVVGVALLIKTIYASVNGDLARELFPDWPGSALSNACAFALSVPVPLHVMAIGLILQYRRLTSGWAKTARFAIVISGCWLGVALGIKILYS